MVAPEDLAAALADPYRVACPRGHTALDPAETTASAYCRTCRQAYPVAELVDKRCEGERSEPSNRASGEERPASSGGERSEPPE